MSLCNEINLLRMVPISELTDIFGSNKQSTDNFKDIELYIDIDKTCMTPEKLFARVFNSNYALRNRIMLNTKKISFNHRDNLIPTRYNLDKFINLCKIIFKSVVYVTKRPNSDIDKIKEELSVHNLPIDINIVNQNYVKQNLSNKFYYIDSDEKTFHDIVWNNKSKNSIYFQLSIF